ncbi:MAG: NADH-quinone oxidoreductase subunit N [Actinomycetes bacterium]|jgi:NADH-quinone oxidoreductase subunit N|nr:NADH-quinone oxidoreductase subunit N [Actinomycetes bacterium]
MTIQSIDLLTLAPTFVVALGALAALIAELVTRRGQVAVAVGLVALLVAVPLAIAASGEQTLCTGADSTCAYVVSPLSVALQLIVLGSSAVVLLMASADVTDRRVPGGEFVFLTLCSVSGAVLIPATNDLVTLIVALEVVSLPIFALVALRKDEPRAAEAALKAFVFSIASVAVSLYGIALLYGSTGVVAFDQLAMVASVSAPTPLATAGLVMLLAVVAFKIAAVPFHAWAPDTYQGATVPVAAYLSVVSKTAGFSALLLITWTFAGWSQVWAPVVAVLAALTMLVGNLVALRQRQAVRLLAWSSIAQAGYILVPLAAVAGSVVWGVGVTGAVVGYLVAYAAMNLGAFAVVAVVASRMGAVTLDDYRGLAWRSPWLAVALAFFLASLAGLPPGLIGLLVKVRVLIVPVDAGLWWLAAVMAVATVIGLAYYLTWAAQLFRRPRSQPTPAVPALSSRWTSSVAVVVCLVVTVLFSVAPSLALGLADRL